jgi:hypothetical protein
VEAIKLQKRNNNNSTTTPMMIHKLCQIQAITTLILIAFEKHHSRNYPEFTKNSAIIFTFKNNKKKNGEGSKKA